MLFKYDKIKVDVIRFAPQSIKYSTIFDLSLLKVPAAAVRARAPTCAYLGTFIVEMYV